MSRLIYPFVITLREALEAALIISIVFAYLVRIRRPDLNKYVWFGTGAAILLSVALGAVVLAVYGGLGGVGKELFEGAAAMTAVVVLTYMIFWMARNARKIKGEFEQKIDVAITNKFLLGIALVTFIAVFREGLETVLFLTASIFTDPAGTAIGAAAGFGTVVVIAFFLLRGTRRLPIRKFFSITSILLLIFAAGILSYGMHEFIEAAEDSDVELGWLGEKAYDINPPENTPFHKKGEVGMVIRGLIGTIYLDPEWLTLFVYLGYWLVVGTFIVKVYAPTKFNGFVDRIFFRSRRVKRQRK